MGGARDEPPQLGLPRPPGTGSPGHGDAGEGLPDGGEREWGAAGHALRRREPADAERPWVGGGKRAPREEGHRGGNVVGRQPAEELRDAGELLEPERARLEPPGERHEPRELGHGAIVTGGGVS